MRIFKLVIILFALFFTTKIALSEVKYNASDLRDPFKSYLPESSISKKSSSAILRELSKMQLSGIMWGDEEPLAIINDKVYKVGDSILGIKIIDVNKQGVLLNYKEENYILKPK